MYKTNSHVTGYLQSDDGPALYIFSLEVRPGRYLKQDWHSSNGARKYRYQVNIPSSSLFSIFSSSLQSVGAVNPPLDTRVQQRLL